MYKELRREYDEYRRGIEDVRQLILTTLDRTNHVYIFQIDSVAEQLERLKERFSLTSEQEQEILILKYRSLLQTPRNVNPEDWIRKWENIYSECRQADIAEVQGNRPIRDFIQSVRNIAPSFADYWSIKINELTGELNNVISIPDLPHLLIQFRNWIRSNQITQSNRGSNHISFGIFQGQSDGISHDHSAYSKSNSSMKPCPCGETHPFISCPYVNWSIRPQGFRENPEIRKKFDQARRHQGFNHAYEKAVEASKREAKERRQEKIQNQNKSAKTSTQASNEELHHSDNEEIPRSNLAFTNKSVSFLVTSNEDDYFRNCTLYDTGTNAHIINNKNRFINFTPIKGFVNVGDTKIPYEGIGDAILYPTDPLCEAAREGFILKDALFIPNNHTNLISASKARKIGIIFDMETNQLKLNGDPLCGIKSEDVYYVQWNNHMSYATRSYPKKSTFPKVLKAPENLWHKRLGHVSSEAIQHLEKSTIGAIVESKSIKEQCETCLLTEAKRQISRIPMNRSTKPFQKIHLDLIQNMMAYNGHVWGIHMVDDYSGFHIFTSTPTKSVQLEVINMLEWLKSRFNVHIHIVHSDNEMALGLEFNEFCKQKHITIEQTVPYTPEQNSIAERSGGVIILRSRAYIIESRLPQGLWPESMKAAVYVLNRTPIKRID